MIMRGVVAGKYTHMLREGEREREREGGREGRREERVSLCDGIVWTGSCTFTTSTQFQPRGISPCTPSTSNGESGGGGDASEVYRILYLTCSSSPPSFGGLTKHFLPFLAWFGSGWSSPSLKQEQCSPVTLTSQRCSPE